MPFKPTCSAVEVSRVMDKQYGWKRGEGYNFKNKTKKRVKAQHAMESVIWKERGRGKGKTQKRGSI